MVKALIFLKRSDNLSQKEFISWWLGPHRELARQLPGLKRFCFNVTQGAGAFDGVAEQWFETIEDLEHAYQTEIGKAVAADSLAHVSFRERIIVEEHLFEGE